MLNSCIYEWFSHCYTIIKLLLTQKLITIIYYDINMWVLIPNIKTTNKTIVNVMFRVKINSTYHKLLMWKYITIGAI